MKRKTILEEADGLVSGDRQQDYGHPRDDYGRVANMVSELWKRKLREPITPEDCILFMLCVKLSRLSNAYKRDSVVDIAGYARVLEMIMEDDNDDEYTITLSGRFTPEGSSSIFVESKLTAEEIKKGYE
jgi:hypothetical protein